MMYEAKQQEEEKNMTTPELIAYLGITARESKVRSVRAPAFAKAHWFGFHRLFFAVVVVKQRKVQAHPGCRWRWTNTWRVVQRSDTTLRHGYKTGKGQGPVTRLWRGSTRAFKDTAAARSYCCIIMFELKIWRLYRTTVR